MDKHTYVGGLKNERFLALLLAVTLTLGCMSGVAYAETEVKPSDGTTKDQPFAAGTAGSSMFRIPCLVTLDDGTLVAASDARWDTFHDGGGLDTIVSYSKDNGTTWNYTLANYMGDNGNEHNTGSTAFIDPILTTDGTNLYLIADLFPAGYALNGASSTPNADAENGFDENGNLRLSNNDRASYDYYLKKADGTTGTYYQILSNADDSVVEGYKVDAYFNISGTSDETADVNTNLFFADSPFEVYPVDYLYLTKSTDGGANWSEPILINAKKEGEQTYLVGPGRGLITKDGTFIIPCYMHDSGTERMSFIYSTDGENWTRTENATTIRSSEAQVVELENGILRFFFRNDNSQVCYVDATGNAETGYAWGDVVRTGVYSCSNTQMSAITYSEKIDGKEAIIISYPASNSDTGNNGWDRYNGRISIGLVQSDGTMDWKYKFEVNEESFWYSCLTELKDGSIGILYEKGQNGEIITYENYTMSEIAPTASIGDIWFTDDDDNVVTGLDMKKGEVITLNVNGLSDVTVQSSNEAALSVSVTDNIVTLTAGDVSDLHQVTVTATSGTEQCNLNVNVVDKDQYEIVELKPGEETKFVDKTGNYEATDLTGVDNIVADVTLNGKDLQIPETKTVIKAQYATATATFDGSKVDLSNCEYTFTKVADNTYEILATTADNQTAYLSYKTASSGSCVNRDTSANITISKHSTNETFSFYDNTSSNNGGYLYFHYDNLTQLYFNRNSSVAENYCYFEIYKASESAPADAEIPGYEKVTSLDEIEDGGKYLIVTNADNNGVQYLLNPSLGTSAYNHVAKLDIEVQDVVNKTADAQYATATATFDGSKVDLSNCEYTFTKVADNTYEILATTADNQTAYLSYKTASSGSCVNRDTSANITISKHSTNETFRFYDNTSSNNGGYLYFHYDNLNQLYFNRNSSAAENYCYFEIYKASESAPADAEIPGYEKVTSLDEIEDGGKYLIVTHADNNGVQYLLNPSLGTSAYNHVAKLNVTSERVYRQEPVVLLGSNTAVFEGGTAIVRKSLYTFTKGTEDGKYYISATDANNKTVYMNHRLSSTTGIVNTENQTEITVAKHSTNETFSFRDTTDTGNSNGQYLYFWRSNTSKLHFDRGGSSSAAPNDDYYFEIYEPISSAAASPDSAVTNYKKITSMDEIEDGGQYLIVTQADTNGSRYVLYPSLGTNVYNHVAQITTDMEYLTENETEITIVANGEGQTSLTVGDVTYYVVVKNSEKNLTLTVGDTCNIPGNLVTGGTEGLVKCEAFSGSAPYEKVDTVNEGKFLVGKDGYIVTNVESSGWDVKGLAMLPVDYATKDYSEYLWTITPVDGGYTIQDENGKYLTFNNHSVTLEDVAQTITVNGTSIGVSGDLLNNYNDGRNVMVGGWTSGDAWYFYQGTGAGVEITALSAGNTDVVIGGTTYHVTIVEPQISTSNIVDQEAKINSVRLSLTDKIGVKFLVQLSDTVTLNDYMNVTVGDTTTQIRVKDATTETSTVTGKTAYVFECNVNAKQMTEDITVQMVVDGKQGTPITYSVKKYADAILSSTNTAYDNAKPMVRAMLNYGGYAQLNFDYETEKLANADLYAEGNDPVAAWSDVNLEAYKPTITNSTLSNLTASMVLETETEIKYYFDLESDKTLDDYQFNLESSNKTLRTGYVDDSQTRAYVAIQGIRPAELQTMYTLKILSGDTEVASIEYSALSYVRQVLETQGSTDNLKNVVKALYLYNQAACTYNQSAQ